MLIYYIVTSLAGFSYEVRRFVNVFVVLQLTIWERFGTILFLVNEFYVNADL